MRGPALFILIVIIILVGAVGGYFIGTHKFPTIGTAFLTPTPASVTVTSPPHSPTSASPSATLSPSLVQAGSVATAFYTWYVDCVNHHFQVKSQNSVSQDCPYQNSPYASAQLGTNLSHATSSDPVFCSQNTPDSIHVGNVTNPTSTTTTATVIETYGNTTHQVVVNLTLENNAWKVSNITCPAT